jgi:hypothetical protein
MLSQLFFHSRMLNELLQPLSSTSIILSELQWQTSLQQTSNSSGTNSDDPNELKEYSGTSDNHGGDGEFSASVKSVNQLMNISNYCRITELRFFEKFLNVKFLENSNVRTELVYKGRQTDNRTDTTKLTVASRNFVNTSKNWGTAQFLFSHYCQASCTSM